MSKSNVLTTKNIYVSKVSVAELPRSHGVANSYKALLTKVSRLLLKHCLVQLGRSTDMEIDLDHNGKPFWRNSELKFNISHSHDWIVCCIAGDPVGIDVQKYIDLSNPVHAAEFIYSLNDFNYYSKSDSKSVIEVWCQKEAAVKLSGIGLKQPFRSIMLDKLPNNTFKAKIDRSECSLTPILIKSGYACWVATYFSNPNIIFLKNELSSSEAITTT